MPSSPNQKMKLLYLMRILLEESDEDTPLTIAEIQQTLARYDIQAERKSIYSDIELLRQFGLDIETRKSKSFGYFIASRQFEMPELKLLVDAVQSSRFITQKKSAELIQKLSTLTSKTQAKHLKRQVFVAERPKAINESVYYSIDTIHAAIRDGYKINFKYFDYDLSKTRAYRKSGEHYNLTPLALCWNDDNYYLICYNAKYDDFNHYRVDRMSDVSICEGKADKLEKGRFNLAEHMKRVFGMFGGERTRAKLRFDQSLINIVLDRFGIDVLLHKDGDCFEVTVDISASPVFLSWIAQFGDKAEIISPDSLRETMRAMICRLSEKYDCK